MVRIINAYSDYDDNIYLVCRSNEKKFIKKIVGFEPYFCVLTKDAYHEEITYLEEQEKIRIETGDTFTKIFVNKSKFLPYIRDRLIDEGIKVFEADIPFVRRFMIDKQRKVGTEPFRHLFLDIETDDTNPKIEIGKEEILSICTIDDTGKRNVFISEGEDKKKREKIMLNNFLAHIRKYDVLLAWNGGNRNGKGFDFPYIMERVSYHKIPVNWREWQFEDAMFLYASGWKKLDKYGEELLNLKKIELNKSIKELYDTDKEKLIEYNMRDVEIMYEAEKKTAMLALKDTISSRSNCFIEELKYNSVIVDMMVLWKVKELGLNLRFPHRKNVKKKDYQGGFVLEPEPGLKKNVFVLDFTSLYNRIIQLGLSSECVYTFFRDNNITVSVDKDNLLTWIPDYFKYITEAKKTPIIPLILEDLELERNIFKKKRNLEEHKSEEWNKYDRLQKAVKVLLLSYYGVMGLPTSRYYDINMAGGITNIARYLIKQTIKKCEELGYKVLYTDTDSVFCQAKTDNVDEQIRIGELLTKELNEYYEELTKKMNAKTDKIDMKFEKVFKTIIFIGRKGKGVKKRYCGLLTAGD